MLVTYSRCLTTAQAVCEHVCIESVLTGEIIEWAGCDCVYNPHLDVLKILVNDEVHVYETVCRGESDCACVLVERIKLSQDQR